MTDNIVDLSAAIKLEPRKKPQHCLCLQVYVDEHTRTIECKSCGRVMDPFDFLMKAARKQNNTVFEIKASQQALGKLQEDIKNLRRERQNLKAQVGRLQRKGYSSGK